jgi:hypothetical protein
MAYTLRFESNAMQQDNKIRQFLEQLAVFGRNVKKIARAEVEEANINELRKFYGISTRTFEYAMDWADENFDEQIKSDQWDWKGPDGKTRRQNGSVVTEPRDIVDTGTLLKSKQRNNINNSTTEFTWTANHAEGVHDGYVSKGGGTNPARPWTQPTLEDIDEVINTIFARRAQ